MLLHIPTAGWSYSYKRLLALPACRTCARISTHSASVACPVQMDRDESNSDGAQSMRKIWNLLHFLLRYHQVFAAREIVSFGHKRGHCICGFWLRLRAHTSYPVSIHPFWPLCTAIGYQIFIWHAKRSSFIRKHVQSGYPPYVVPIILN